MLLHQIIKLSEEGKTGILIELIQPYKKSLSTYFERYYTSKPALVVTAVFNAAQYGFICPSDEMQEAIETYLNGSDLSEEDKESEREIILFNSLMLETL